MCAWIWCQCYAYGISLLIKSHSSHVYTNKANTNALLQYKPTHSTQSGPEQPECVFRAQVFVNGEDSRAEKNNANQLLLQQSKTSSYYNVYCILHHSEQKKKKKLALFPGREGVNNKTPLVWKEGRVWVAPPRGRRHTRPSSNKKTSESGVAKRAASRGEGGRKEGRIM